MGTPHHTQLHHEDCFLRLCSPCNGCGLEINWIVTGEETVACVPPGETINFNWEGPWHNVVEMGDDIPSYADCILDADETEAGRDRGLSPSPTRGCSCSCAGS